MKYSAARLVLAVVVIGLVLGVAVLFLFLYSEGPWVLGPSDVGSFSLSGSVDTLLVRTDGVLYQVGDTVDAEGVVRVVAQDSSVEVDIVDPEGELWSSGEVEVKDEVGRFVSFSASLRRVQDGDPSGVYLLRARYGGVQNTSFFLVSTPSGLTSKILNLHLQGMSGEEVSDVRVGDIVMVAGSVINEGGVAGEFSFIVEVRDKDSSITQSGYVSTNISPGEEKTLTVGWPAKDEGLFTVYAYIKDDPQSRRIISNVATLSFQVSP